MSPAVIARAPGHHNPPHCTRILTVDGISAHGLHRLYHPPLRTSIPTRPSLSAPPASTLSQDDMGEEAHLVLKPGRDQGKGGYEPGKLGPGGVEIDPMLKFRLCQGYHHHHQ